MLKPEQPAQPTRAQAKFRRRVIAATQRAFAPGREERIAKAQAKRDRKNAKRARDAERSDLGKIQALLDLRVPGWREQLARGESVVITVATAAA